MYFCLFGKAATEKISTLHPNSLEYCQMIVHIGNNMFTEIKSFNQ